MFVYFLKCKGDHGHLIKIGKANDPQQRMRDLQVGCPLKLELIGAIPCKSELQALQLEKRIHRIFKGRHRRGEWFNIGDFNLEVIKRSLRESDLSEKANEINDGLDRSFKEAIDSPS